MWNYGSIFPTICILIIIYGFYIARPRLPLRSKRTFVLLLVVEEFTMLSDMVATLMDENYEQYSVAILYVINAAFFILFYLRTYLFYRYTIYLTKMSFKDTPAKSVLYQQLNLICMVITLCSPFTGWMFSITENGYVSGPLYSMLYVHGFAYLCLAMILLLRHRHRVTEMHFKGGFFYILVLMVGLLVRILYPLHLVMDMFSMCAIAIIFLAVENPEFHVDQRTELFNRDSLDLMVEEANNYMDYKMVAFVIKDYQENRDVYTSPQMDNGLEMIARFLKETFPDDCPFYARNGRFVILTEKGDTEVIRSKIRERFLKPWLADQTELFLDVGFVVYDSELKLEGTQIVATLRYALGRVSHMDQSEDLVISGETAKVLEHQIQVRKALERALENNTVEVYLQPVVRATTFELVGAEALARITDPEMGFLMPDEFISLAEANGSIGVLGRQVFEKTCAFIRDHNDEIGLEWVNVNLSPIQCMNKNLPNEFSEILKDYDISSNKLHLEITEQSIIDAGVLKNQMQIMVREGFQFALDDYGSGYSNAMGVVSYPLSNIKIDRGIVQSYFDNPSSLLPNEIKIFLDMQFSVTAEGVETLEMAEKLAEFGCTYLQGYYFSKPIPIPQFIEKYSKK